MKTRLTRLFNIKPHPIMATLVFVRLAYGMACLGTTWETWENWEATCIEVEKSIDLIDVIEAD